MSRRTALIAGAGIGGLAAAIALRKAGLEVQVLERARELREIGAALVIWTNGTRALRALGVEARTMAVRRYSMRDRQGSHLRDTPIGELASRHGFEMTFIHRADLQTGLLGALGADAVRLGAEVMGFSDYGDHVEAVLRSGQRVRADLLVGADGLRSAVRRQLLHDGEPQYLGASIWRGMADSDGIPIEAGEGVDWVGRASEFLAIHLAGGRIYWAAVTREPQGADAGAGGHKLDVATRFETWPGPIPALIAATDEQAVIRNDMYDRPPARHWSRGRVTLLGDAAHPMTPHAGQGACQALEDSVALGECLASTGDPVAALKLYESRRLRRANWVVKASHQAARVVQLNNPFLCALRDASTRFMPESVLIRLIDNLVAIPGAPG